MGRYAAQHGQRRQQEDAPLGIIAGIRQNVPDKGRQRLEKLFPKRRKKGFIRFYINAFVLKFVRFFAIGTIR